MLADFKAKIQTFLDRGESVQIIAPPGFGKSRFGRSFQKHIYLDFNLVAPKSLDSVLQFFKDNFHVSDHMIIILDEIDELLTPDYQPFWVYLKAVRDQYKTRLSYLFLVHQPISAKNRPLLGDLFEIASEHLEYLPVLDTSEYDLFGLSPTQNNLKTIKKLSGGIPALVKICSFALRDNTPLTPDSNPKLAGFLEELVTASPHHPAYSQSQIIQDYLSTRSSSDLSASETRLFELLKTHSGQIVSKDQICEAVYPDVKNQAGISDHSIDQLIHRLRAKVSKDYQITTHRGLGYKIT